MRSIRSYIGREQLKLCVTIVLLVYVLSIVIFYWTASLRSARRAEDHAAFVQNTAALYWERFQAQADALNESQPIRTYLAYYADNPSDKSEALSALGKNMELPGNVTLYDAAQQIYPVLKYPSALPSAIGDAPESRGVLLRPNGQRIQYFFPYYNFTQTQKLGYLCFSDPVENLATYLQRAIPGNISYALFDSNGQLLADRRPDSKRVASAEHALSGFGVSCVAEVDLMQEYGTVFFFLLCLLPVLLLVFGISVLYSGRIAVRMSQPINLLIASIRHNQRGELTYSGAFMSQIEELDTLARSYQELMLNLRELVDKNQKANVLRMESQLNMLQERINPHFLFNTLELISSQAVVEHADKTAVLTQKLGALFRYSLRAPDVLPLKRELQYAKDYLFLQKVRFNDQVTYEIEMPPAFTDSLFPKMTLQPLLENCFKHGFDDAANMAHHIRIDLSEEDGALVLAISDDGSGITAERAEELNRAMRQDRENFAYFIKRREHIGVRNVNARLCLHFGVERALWLSPGPSGGTRAEIRLPREKLVPTDREVTEC